MATRKNESGNAAQSGPWHISSSFEALGRVSSGAKCASGRPQVKLCSTVISRGENPAWAGKVAFIFTSKVVQWSKEPGRQFLSIFKPDLVPSAPNRSGWEP